MTRNSKTPRGGYTLIELLVALAIVAVCVGLILAAVQSARLSAARQASMNDIRQLVLASHSFATANGGLLPNVDGDFPTPGRSVFQALCPYLEANPDAPPPILRAKTDPSRWSPSSGLAPPTLPDGTASPAISPQSCSFVVNPYVYAVGMKLPASLTDGASTTIAITEHYGTCGPTTYYWALTQVRCKDGATGKIIPCVASSAHRPTFADAIFDDVLPPGTLPLTFQVRPPLSECDPRIPQSSLPGGILLGLADGSVRFTRQSIEPTVFWGAVTPNGGEVISLD